MIPIVIGTLGTIHKVLVRGLEELEIGGRAESIQNYSIDEFDKNTEKRPGDLRRLAVALASVKT